MSRRSAPTLRSSQRYRLLGPAPKEASEALLADIKTRGIQRAVEIDEDGYVLDGHLRVEIARRLHIDCPTTVKRFPDEEAKVEHILKANLLHRSPGPVSWARGFSRLLELRGVPRKPGPSGISPTVGLIAEELGVPRSTAFRRLQLAELLADHPELAAKVDLGELTASKALLEAGAKKVSKPDLGGGVSHPARFSAALLPAFAELLEGATTVLDPFAGTGRIHELVELGFDTYGIEIEPEWAAMHERTDVGDALALEYEDGEFDAICTSPTYGNRNADHHDAKDASTRRSYRHDLGRALHKHNSGRLQWGAAYREFHELAWEEALRVLKEGGRFVLNIKDHVRAGRRQYVAGWHVTTLCRMGATLLEHREVKTPAMKAGSNGDLRVSEQVYLFIKDRA